MQQLVSASSSAVVAASLTLSFFHAPSFFLSLSQDFFCLHLTLLFLGAATTAAPAPASPTSASSGCKCGVKGTRRIVGGSETEVEKTLSNI